MEQLVLGTFCPGNQLGVVKGQEVHIPPALSPRPGHSARQGSNVVLREFRGGNDGDVQKRMFSPERSRCRRNNR